MFYEEKTYYRNLEEKTGVILAKTEWLAALMNPLDQSEWQIGKKRQKAKKGRYKMESSKINNIYKKMMNCNVSAHYLLAEDQSRGWLYELWIEFISIIRIVL